ncbi:MAG: 30S ribosomal protein S14 [Pseudomonadota bacterium]|nr:30S ribosomal protein S14 [Gammaproteobacteria bacterium]MBU1559161.1 30S ribosomal protein S14 [Gammaproteobacteria bacterium]MBU1628800.1 30S ribosomal protein S14 [Gammaproteobacteria bacterium]MBU1926366.1 30S ribosomal protein S14 [Gammaproteobacteria bacterium]MBU2545983.1 30S ribosomal protein S14 [Gammaproteobacteria bacterium]
MAKKSRIARNEQRKIAEKKFRAKREALKLKRAEAYKNGESPWNIMLALQKLPRSSNPTRIRRRCNLCGRSRGVYRKFGLCRECLRKFAMQGYIPGLTKASW